MFNVLRAVVFKSTRSFSEAAVNTTTKPKFKQPRDYLKPFLLKVHPDLLPDPNRQVNEKSLTTLNSLIHSSKDPKRPLTTEATTYSLEFFLKPVGIQKPRRITAEVLIPALTPDQDNTPYVDRLLARLFQLAEIKVPPQELSRWQRVWATAEQVDEANEISKRVASFSMDDISGLNRRPNDEQLFDEIVKEEYKDQAFKDDYDPYAEPRFSLIKTMDEEKMIKFDPDVNGWEQLFALKNLHRYVEDHFEKLDAYQWIGVPFRITVDTYETPSLESPNGLCFTFPYNITARQFITYVTKYVDRVAAVTDPSNVLPTGARPVQPHRYDPSPGNSDTPSQYDAGSSPRASSSKIYTPPAPETPADSTNSANPATDLSFDATSLNTLTRRELQTLAKQHGSVEELRTK